ncbi:hypothetical protein [uncultured Cohaesibacter sp.]|uniref:hypothetical protein n=1 Tax=uncultured Cohaesibacter sp. TaxID=1002546 RepID=UPI00292DEEA1|nr:hypothetical protein [uncultured Cohaesibacter sp.]
MTSQTATRQSLCLLSLGMGLALGLLQAHQVRAEPTRDEHDNHAISRWINLPHERQLLVLQALGVTIPQAFYNCVCKSAGYGTSGTHQYYHPDTIGKYNKTYACQHPGPPCVVAGFGCTRHDLPKDPKIYERCAAQSGLKGGNPLDNILSALDDRANRKGLTGNPVDMEAKKPDPEQPANCASQRQKFVVKKPEPFLKDVRQDKRIYAISPEFLKEIDRWSIPKEVQQKLFDYVNKASETMHHTYVGDELDWRFDFDLFEIGVSRDKRGKMFISEIVYKHSPPKGAKPVKVAPEFAIKMGRSRDYKEKSEYGYVSDDLDIFNMPTGFKAGYVAEGKYGEGKIGVDVDFTRRASDYYDGEWQRESEYAVVRMVENMVSWIDGYVGGSVNVDKIVPTDLRPDGGIISFGPEISFSLRERFSNLLFSDMHAALDNMLDNQKRWENQRKDYIAEEAKRFGLDSRCFTTGELITLTKQAYEAQKQSDPFAQEPFLRLKNKARKNSK